MRRTFRPSEPDGWCCALFAQKASGRILQKLGMRYEGCQRQHILKWGDYLDSEIYALLRTEYGS